MIPEDRDNSPERMYVLAYEETSKNIADLSQEHLDSLDLLDEQALERRAEQLYGLTDNIFKLVEYRKSSESASRNLNFTLMQGFASLYRSLTAVNIQEYASPLNGNHLTLSGYAPGSALKLYVPNQPDFSNSASYTWD